MSTATTTAATNITEGDTLTIAYEPFGGATLILHVEKVGAVDTFGYVAVDGFGYLADLSEGQPLSRNRAERFTVRVPA